MFRRGTAYGSRGSIPMGGQDDPSDGAGASLLWKKAQKNEKKKATSETIKRIIPIRRPRITGDVWWPRVVLSRVTSRHHWNIVKFVMVSPVMRQRVVLVWNQIVRPQVRERAPVAAVRGQGLSSTR